MYNKKVIKPMIFACISMLFAVMVSAGVYADEKNESHDTIGYMEQELEKYFAERNIQIEVGSDEYIEYLFDLLTFEDDRILAENKHYEQIKIYASEYLSKLNDLEATEENEVSGAVSYRALKF